MEMALVLKCVVAAAFVLLPACVAAIAFRRFRISRSTNKPLYAAMSCMSFLFAIWVMGTLLAGQWPSVVLMGMAGSMLPIWLMLRTFCGLNTSPPQPPQRPKRTTQKV